MPRPKECECDVPRLRAYKTGSCLRCARVLSSDYLSSDQNLSEFFTLLADIPQVDAGLLRVAADREREGRTQYGLAYLGKQNLDEAVEELADLIIYCYLHWLRARRDGYEVDMAALLEAVTHGCSAYNALKRV